MLSITKVELELISDENMSLFFEKGTGGGVSYIFKRCSKANNKYLKLYEPKQETKHIIYLEANNLYGFTMSKSLSADGFRWTDPKEFDLNIAAIVRKVVF